MLIFSITRRSDLVMSDSDVGCHLASEEVFECKVPRTRNYHYAPEPVDCRLSLCQRHHSGTVDDFNPRKPVVGVRGLHVQRFRPELP